MRNPDRIPIILNKLATFWNDHPDFRLGQIIEIMRSHAGDKTNNSFCIEDEVIEQQLDLFNKD